jgi:redox-sensitive bicupin YhaK (pirin superfamily)
MKKILGIYGSPKRHWVGDGFPVQTLFTYSTLGRHISPFLKLDYVQPTDFPASLHKRGGGQHPRRGLEMVTIVYQGELEYQDSTGAGGRIRPGDVQWMTAAGGILHEEYHSPDFSGAGGTLEMVQLWVNLPATQKLAEPRFQLLVRQDIPQVDLPGGVGQVRVIAGRYAGRQGPAHTVTPMEVWDVRLHAHKRLSLHLKSGFTCAVALLQGAVRVNGVETLSDSRLVLFDSQCSELLLESSLESILLLLSGQPIDEPIIGYGPFVMNTEAQIAQAIEDFETGEFGLIHPVSS